MLLVSRLEGVNDAFQARNSIWPSTVKCFRMKTSGRFDRSGIKTVTRGEYAKLLRLEIGIFVHHNQKQREHDGE